MRRVLCVEGGGRLAYIYYWTIAKEVGFGRPDANLLESNGLVSVTFLTLDVLTAQLQQEQYCYYRWRTGSRDTVVMTEKYHLRDMSEVIKSYHAIILSSRE